MKPNLYVWLATLFASFGSILTGYYDGSMSGIVLMDGFQELFTRSDVRNETNSSATSTCSTGEGADSDFLLGLVVSISGLGSAFGSLAAGWLADLISRKYALLLSGVVFSIGSALLFLAFNIIIFIVGRGISGFGIGIIYMIMPVYIAEISPKTSRGMLCSLIGPGYALGMLIGLTANLGFSRFSLGWRVTLGVQATAGLIFAITMKWMPFTPRYLVMKERYIEALQVMYKVNHTSDEGSFVDVFLELEDLKSASCSNCVTDNPKCCMRYRDLFMPKYLFRLFVLIVLFFLLAFMGTFVYYFVPTLFCEVGINPFVTVLAVGVIMLLSSLLLVISIEKMGRKTVLVYSAAINIFLAGGVAALAHIFSGSSTVVTYVIVVLICVYAFSFSYSWLTVPFIIASEVFPINIRGITVAICTFSFWFFTFLSSQVIPLILGSPLQVSGFFYILVGINLLALVFVFVIIPETNGVSLEDMDKLFSRRCFVSSDIIFPFRRSLKGADPPKLQNMDSEFNEEYDFKYDLELAKI